MLYKYSDYIKDISLIEEGSTERPDVIYWINQLEKIINVDWTDISTYEYSKRSNKFYIKFKAFENDGDKKEIYAYYSVLIEKKGNNDIYYMEDNENNVSEKFKKKLNKEFFKNASEYVKNMAYDPKCLGDLSHVRTSNKYNI